jgi:hypothetical protein
MKNSTTGLLLWDYFMDHSFVINSAIEWLLIREIVDESATRVSAGSLILSPRKVYMPVPFFGEAKLPRKTIFLLSYFWAQEYDTFDKVEYEIKIKRETNGRANERTNG